MGELSAMTALSQSVDRLLDDPAYPSLKEYVIATTGLAYYADKDPDFVRRLCRRWPSLGVRSCSAYLELLRDRAHGASEMDALVTEITIGESHFFRHQEHFDALRDLVLPALIAQNSQSRRIRIWCAGCADGAEPYSLSVLMKREMGHLFDGWDVAILATDINRQALSAAQEGRFEGWSFRSTPEDFRRACFLQEGKYWQIHARYRDGVSFQYHNLVQSSFPPVLGCFSGFDLVICRNVMIYFGPEVMGRIVRQFHECLAGGGWLLVGPSEPNMTHFTSFRPINAPGVTLYQKDLQAAPAPSYQAPLPPAALPLRDEPDVSSPETPPDQSAPEVLASIRHFADRGEWDSAARLCQELLKQDSFNSLVHFHYALVLEQTGEKDEAERSLRRTIYLDRQSVLAHYHLGTLLRSRGDRRQALRCFDNTVELLVSRPDVEILAGTDGMTVAELRKLADAQRSVLSTHLRGTE
jgi:chemotaxis protein methyltransferase CheR